MIEVIAAAGPSVRERHRLFKISLEQFAGRRPDALTWMRSILRKKSKALAPLRMMRNQVKRSKKLAAALQGLPPDDLWATKERDALPRQVFQRLKSGGRFEPRECVNMTWEALESKYFVTTEWDPTFPIFRCPVG